MNVQAKSKCVASIQQNLQFYELTNSAIFQKPFRSVQLTSNRNLMDPYSFDGSYFIAIFVMGFKNLVVMFALLSLYRVFCIDDIETLS